MSKTETRVLQAIELQDEVMDASQAERDEHFRTVVAPYATYDFRTYNVWDNGEFMTGATVDLLVRGEVVETREFTGSNEDADSYREGSAAVQAASYAWAWVESMETPLEERLAPFGSEWQREMEERFSEAVA